jgi:hypothetical protein
LPDKLSGIFLREGLDDPNHADMSGKFRLSPQRLEVTLALTPPVIPGRCEASSYDVQLHIRESISQESVRPDGFSDVQLHIIARATRAPE